MMLPVRYPKFDFESCFPRWAPHLEFAHMNNAASITPCTLEPFMIKVFQKAKERLDPARDAKLIEEVDWFIAQEAQHYRAHARFNKCFQTDRFPKMVEFERQFMADLNGYIDNRSLEFCLAYSEGFESSGAVWYKVWFEDLDDYFEGAHPDALALFNWHYAEEYEHREVAYKLFMAVAARGSLWRRVFYGYFYRIYGVFVAMKHIHGYTGLAKNHLMEVERAEMTEAEREASIARENEVAGRIAAKMKRGMKGIFSPFYNPAKKPPPRGYEAMLEQFEPGGRFGRALA